MFLLAVPGSVAVSYHAPETISFRLLSYNPVHCNFNCVLPLCIFFFYSQNVYLYFYFINVVSTYKDPPCLNALNGLVWSLDISFPFYLILLPLRSLSICLFGIFIVFTLRYQLALGLLLPHFRLFLFRLKYSNGTYI